MARDADAQPTPRARASSAPTASARSASTSTSTRRDTPTPAAADTRVNALLSDASKRIDATRERLSHGEREGLERDLGRIRDFYDNEFERDGARGFALFVSGDYWSTVALPDPVPDVVDLGRGFNIGPLAPLVGRGDGTLVAFVGRERGQLFRLRAAGSGRSSTGPRSSPGRHDQGGWSQSRYQRHIENLVAEHLRDVASELDHVVRNRARRRSSSSLGRDARRVHRDAPARGEEVGSSSRRPRPRRTPTRTLLELVQPLLDEAHAADERAALDRWREEAAKGRAASGWEETLEAASDARVELLLYDEGANRPAHECPSCGRASLGRRVPARRDALEPRESGFDLAVHRTVQNGGSLLAVGYQRRPRPGRGDRRAVAVLAAAQDRRPSDPLARAAARTSSSLSAVLVDRLRRPPRAPRARRAWRIVRSV